MQNAGGDLVCTLPAGVGSTTAPENYGTSYGGTYGIAPPATSSYAPVMPPSASAHYPPAYPAELYAAPPYYGYGPNPYPPAPGQYVAPSATRAAQPAY